MTQYEDNKWYKFSTFILPLIIAALSLLLSLYLAYRDGELAEQYLALDLQEKRPFLAPVVQSETLQGGTLQRWSWGARNSGSVVSRVVYYDLQRKGRSDWPWKSTSDTCDEIVYPGETIQLMRETGPFSGITVTCVVFEDVQIIGEPRRWVGYAQYFCTDMAAARFNTDLKPKMRLIHRTERRLSDDEPATCNAVDWWSQLPSVRSGMPEE